MDDAACRSENPSSAAFLKADAEPRLTPLQAQRGVAPRDGLKAHDLGFSFCKQNRVW